MQSLSLVPMTSRSSRPKPTPIKETQKPKKDMLKRLVLVCESPRKHTTIQKQKKDRQPENVVDLEVKHGTEDIDIVGVKPIT